MNAVSRRVKTTQRARKRALGTRMQRTRNVQSQTSQRRV
jgi:hypothetical protein